MVYSSRKPYQRTNLGVREFYRAPARNLKDSIGPESVYEKPYVTKEYGDMHQSMNIPLVPPDIGGVGTGEGLVCLYNPDDCEISASCYAGGAIRIEGGPEEAGAGYVEPVIIKGDLADWSIAEDKREVHLTFDPNVDQNIIEVGFVDGWGVKHTQVLDSSCFAGSCGFSADDNFTGVNGAAPNTDRWTRTLWANGLCQISGNRLVMYSNSYGGLAKCQHNGAFNNNFDISLDWGHGGSGGSVPVNWYIDLLNIANGYRVRFYRGNNPSDSYNNYIYVRQYDGSWSTTYTDTSAPNGLFTGKLQFIRSGNSLAVWVSNDGIAALTLRDTMAAFGSGLVLWHIYLPNASNSNLNTWYFDNFVLNAGFITCTH